jgi:aldose 1-epimerase
VTATGGGLRELSLDSRPILAGFAEDELAPSGAGQVLAPWPNRLEDGSYTFGGTHATVALNEPARQNAIHGFVRWLDWQPVSQREDGVALRCHIAPQPAYPWPVELELDYLLRSGELTVTVRASNRGAVPAPFGVGFHPYFAAGRGGVDAARLFVPATAHLRADERGLPVGREEIELGALAPRAPGDTSGAGVPLAGVVLDDCFTDLRRGPDGAWRIGFAPDGDPAASIEIFADEHFGFVMCFTADTLETSRRRRAVAIEPMTCAPNALRTGDGLITLEPDQPFTASWGIRFGG